MQARTPDAPNGGRLCRSGDTSKGHDVNELPNELLRLYAPELECGSDGYPYAWHESIKHEVRAAAGHRCVRCGHPYPPGIAADHPRGEWTPCDELCDHDGPGRHEPTVIDRKPAPEGMPAFISDDGWVHFDNADVPWFVDRGIVIEARWRILTVHHLDARKWNCLWWNLAALCQRCHLQIQGKVRMAQTYPFEHAEWFKPYAAGYYAWGYLGQTLGRSETMERLDELLALELIR